MRGESPSPDAGGIQPALADAGVSRRDVLKTGAASLAAGGVLAAGGSDAMPNTVDPVDDAEAAIPVVAGAAVIGVAATLAFGASLSTSEYEILGGGDQDEYAVIEDFVYNNAVAVAEGRSAFEQEMQANLIDPNTNQTGFAESAWQNVRAAVAEELANSGSTSEAERAANRAVDEQATVAMLNNIERWNTGVNALVNPLVVSYEETGQLGYENDTIDSLSSGDMASYQELVNASEVESGGYMVARIRSTHEKGVSGGLDLPLPATEVEGREEPAQLLGIGTDGNSPTVPDFPGIGNDEAVNRTLEVTHPDSPTTTVLDGSLYAKVFDAIEAGRSQIKSDIPDYVQSVSDGYQEGDIDLSDVLSTGDIFDQFSSSPEQQRLASNLLSVGLPVPENTGVEALISHPDLQSDEVWGHLYPRFSVEDPAPIQPGTTLPSSDYSMAYFGSYNSDGELNTQILSGDSDLQVLDVTGLDDTSDVSVESRDGSAGENSGVVIYRGEDPPVPIQYPADHSDWTIVITGATNQSTHSPSEVAKDGNEYSIPSTDLAAGEGVEEVRLVPPSNYTDPVEPVTNATDTDAEELTSALESVKEKIDEIEQSGSNAGGAALGSLPSLPDWIPGKGPVRWVVAGGGALLGIKLIDASSG